MTQSGIDIYTCRNRPVHHMRGLFTPGITACRTLCSFFFCCFFVFFSGGFDDERLNHILRLRTADLQPLELQMKMLYKSTVAAALSDAAAELLMVLGPAQLVRRTSFCAQPCHGVGRSVEVNDMHMTYSVMFLLMCHHHPRLCSSRMTGLKTASTLWFHPDASAICAS